MSTISNLDDIIDSRQIIDRIADLIDDPDLADYSTELTDLQELAATAAPYAEDWEYGEQLIRYSYFVEYAQELAEDIWPPAVPHAWPTSHIDWQAAADELQQDYTEVNFAGVPYWIR